MPPKAKPRTQDFSYSADLSEVQCKVCATGEWIAERSAAKHLQGQDHLKNVDLVEIERKRELEKDRQAESAATELRSIDFAPHRSATGPIASTSVGCHGKSAAEDEMWQDYATNGATFSAGDLADDVQMQHERLRQEADSFGFWNPEGVARDLGFGTADVEGQIIAEDEEEDFLAEIMRNAGLEEPEAVEIQNDGGPAGSSSSSNSEWFPYPSKMMFLLDTLDNLPRLCISGSLMRVFLWVLKEAHCKDVPSFDHLRRVQKSIRSECGIPTIPCKSVQGNVFFMNDPVAIIAQDWENPVTRKLIHDGIIREIWHAQKWRANMDLDILSPMYDAGTSHYYVNEVLRLKNGLFVIPIRWVICDDKVHADVFSISFNDQGEAAVIDNPTSLASSDDFSDNYLDLQHAGTIPKWAATSIESGHTARMPNPKHIIAGGDPMYCSFVDYFSDDVSGNRTKSWNKHWNEFHVHFVSTPPNASATEQYKEFKTRVEATHTDPVKVRDETGETTCLSIYVVCGPSDNPMQSEISGHIGGKGNHFCRKCKAGEHILAELGDQVKLACSGVAQPVKDSQTRTGVKDMYTQYWIDELISRFKDIKKDDPARSNTNIQEELVQWLVGFDPTRDTPVEILHTILLGIVKYIWHISHSAWSEEKKKTYALCLQSTTTDGLSIHAIRANYIMKYAGSLIGRQFKTIAQTNIFHVYGLVTDHQFMAWRASGELAALLWFPEIRNLEEYRRDLKVAVANVLDIFAMIDPSKIITKIKYHLLAHIDQDAVEFGPLVGVVTEIFECFNVVFCFCSILSNHLAPSRDIAIQLGNQEGLKHRLTGGWWQIANKEWQRAGPSVRHFMLKHPVLQRLLGWSESNILVHGTIKLLPFPRGQKERVNHKLGDTSAVVAVNFGLYSAESTWKKCLHVISESLDQCLIGSWVFAGSATDKSTTISGRISDILQDHNGSVLIVLELFQVSKTRDMVTGMPILLRQDSEILFSILPAKNIQFKFNVQHDCYSVKCEATGVRLRVQERVESDQIENYIVHNALDRYLINSHAFHNAHLLRATLHRDIIAPVPVFADRRGKHDELATELRANLDIKQGKQKGKGEKKDRKKADEVNDELPQPQTNKRKRKARNAAAEDEPPRKRAQPGTVSPEVESLVAGRSKRTIIPSTRLKDSERNEETDDEEGPGDEDEDPRHEENEDSDDEDLYENSDGDYSD
ncbi:hypothetical protein C8R44DRAFT_836011 [Mycena epipterygia]|nr:hypothetical protein C8R44DRAFT_836011 [Mycena epipterygia]